MPTGIFIRTKEHKRKIGEISKQNWQNPEYREMMGRVISMAKKGKPSGKKGKLYKFKSFEERHQVRLERGRKCYRKHIEQRRFYYRQLDCKRRNIGGKHNYKQWLKLKKRYNSVCQICRKKEPEIKLTEDHIIPISKWNEWIKNHPEIVYQCNDIDNIQPLCFPCNMRKFNHILETIGFMP